MARADLHVHSMYSERPANWFLQRIGASESYTRPESIYEQAMARGMDFVTVTDHNCMEAALILKEKYPAKAFTGVESTTYFPENGCKIHLLLYGLTESDFKDVQKARKDIYQLRELVRERNIAHSVAHATYSINGRLSLDMLEKLMLLFNVFEGVNGARSMASNTTWTAALRSLTPERMEGLKKKHGILPMGEKSWIKGFTGGSDDHSGLFIAKACTCADGSSPEAFLQALKKRESLAEGKHNDAKSLAFALYKIAYDFSMTESTPLHRSALSRLGDAILRSETGPGDEAGLVDKGGEEGQIRLLLAALSEDPGPDMGDPDPGLWLEGVYDKITKVSDAFFRNILLSIVNDLRQGNFDHCIRNFSSLLPGIFLSIPFFMTLRHMQDGRRLLEDLRGNYLDSRDYGKKILWFTDTFHEMNGVAATLREIAGKAQREGLPIRIVTSLPSGSARTGSDFSPETLTDLSTFLRFPLPYYENIEIRVPSILRAIQKLGAFEVDEICISTPGPVGLLGLLLAKLLNLPCKAVYHTDFAAQTRAITGSESLCDVVDNAVRLFYSFADEILVPSRIYMDILADRGLEPSRMRLFLRAVDTELFAPHDEARSRMMRQYGIGAGKILLYTGRISKDKNIGEILEMHRCMQAKGHNVHMLLAGDGPDLENLKKETAANPAITFTGRIPREELPVLYSGADLLLFPSTTDTFGMVVLEAQACGLPVFVSDKGGPMEIVLPGKTGEVLPAGNMDAWVMALSSFLRRMDIQPLTHARMRSAARKRGLEYSWENALETIFSGENTEVYEKADLPAA
ncbi:glycosyltransferase involved in cell wall biosynthesis [Desulfobotulus alkaliphilus]|uniref:Glycosyltransferase involved in cell wall biosynthesis n=1 Tax=Desulfobotulus alkaliphilus TaxID=622671 RepID=A0A562RY47_9BACT|nr:glycosyltransferase [Desulfobotulus alkaliphilus]TWI73977.1 glycosyltransferase involved in cell wall biosynthesis [Desulfobotulus alkaliphilus]